MLKFNGSYAQKICSVCHLYLSQQESAHSHLGTILFLFNLFNLFTSDIFYFTILHIPTKLEFDFIFQVHIKRPHSYKTQVLIL